MSAVPNAILIIRLSSLGDVLLSTPIVRQLRKALPSARIDFVLDTHFAEVYAANPYINHLWQYNRQWRWQQRLRWKQQLPTYDVVIDLQKNLHSLLIRWRTGAVVRKVHKDRLRKLLAVYTPINPYDGIVPIPERYRQTIADWIEQPDLEGLELWLPEERSLQQYPPAHHTGSSHSLIACAPGARHFTKRWLPESFIRLIATLYADFRISAVLVGGAEDRPLCEHIARNLPAAAVAGIECHRSIYATARVLDQVSLVVSNDSAVVHIAAARRKPVVALYGSTIPAFGFVPYRVPFQLCEVEQLACRPCTHYGRSRCPRRHFRCMRDLSVASVRQAIERLLELSDGPSLVVKYCREQ